MNNLDLRQELYLLLTMYIIKKNIKMKPVFKSIRDQIISNHQMTKKQFLSIITFIKREPRFRSKTDDQILKHFSPLIRGYITPESQSINLETFFI